MRFWDSSAIVPLVCREATSATARGWLREDRVVLVWSFTPTEVISALTRRRREGALDARPFAEAKRRLRLLEEAWSQVVQYEAVQARARRLLESHALRAADALQLSAALVAVEDRPQRTALVTLDARLAAAAEKEGFTVLTSA